MTGTIFIVPTDPGKNRNRQKATAKIQNAEMRSLRNPGQETHRAGTYLILPLREIKKMKKGRGAAPACAPTAGLHEPLLSRYAPASPRWKHKKMRSWFQYPSRGRPGSTKTGSNENNRSFPPLSLVVFVLFLTISFIDYLFRLPVFELNS